MAKIARDNEVVELNGPPAFRYGDKVLTPVVAPATGMLSGLFGRRSAGPGRKGRRCGRHGAIDVGRRARRDRREQLLGGRVDDVQGLGSRRRDPGSVDVEGIANDHGAAPCSRPLGAAQSPERTTGNAGPSQALIAELSGRG